MTNSPRSYGQWKRDAAASQGRSCRRRAAVERRQGRVTVAILVVLLTVALVGFALAVFGPTF